MIRYTPGRKAAICHDVLSGNIHEWEARARHQMTSAELGAWLQAYQECGIEGLYIKKKVQS